MTDLDKSMAIARDEPAPDTLDDLTISTAIPRARSQDVASRFAHVHTWVFDLDNTLYPADSTLWPQIDRQITLFLMNLFGIDGLSARALQKYYYRQYGTSLHGLMIEHKIGHTEFLAFAHDIDRSDLLPNPRLAQAIARLPGRKLVLTNGSRDHALKTAAQLGLNDLFEDVFDIVAADLVPKPDPVAYDKFFAQHAVDPRRAAMFEDLSRNLIVPHERGMLTTLIVPTSTSLDHREAWEQLGGGDVHVDFVTDDLTQFLVDLMPLGS
ncbi:pyrimidine 5'-nucleotidase [Lichenihabitans psoromatis]|uniref:pyrimidine 5'-nucleotidase n=1 Tax=Lichenihabitans psoromatis TaxID=2528642 RepID=UPI001FDF1B0F|nr:pyrimidine 5'-nucleotidase [Lichenihabitans psoromatis]